MVGNFEPNKTLCSICGLPIMEDNIPVSIGPDTFFHWSCWRTKENKQKKESGGETMREKIAICLYQTFHEFAEEGYPWQTQSKGYKEKWMEKSDKIISLPSGLIAGEHELTIQEKLELCDKMIEALEEICEGIEYGDYCQCMNEYCRRDCKIGRAQIFYGQPIRRNHED